MAKSIEDAVKLIVVEQLGVHSNEVTSSANFETHLGADSLDVIELVMAVEEEFGIEIDDNDYDSGQLPTVGKLVEYVERRMKKAA